MNITELEAMKPGDRITRYGFFVNLVFVNYDQNNSTVVMKDKSGNNKEVYLSLFLKHASAK